jgi:hypothetical protein
MEKAEKKLVFKEKRRRKKNILMFIIVELFEQILCSLGCYRLTIDSQMTMPTNKLH